MFITIAVLIAFVLPMLVVIFSSPSWGKDDAEMGNAKSEPYVITDVSDISYAHTLLTNIMNMAKEHFEKDIEKSMTVEIHGNGNACQIWAEEREGQKCLVCLFAICGESVPAFLLSEEHMDGLYKKRYAWPEEWSVLEEEVVYAMNPGPEGLASYCFLDPMNV